MDVSPPLPLPLKINKIFEKYYLKKRKEKECQHYASGQRGPEAGDPSDGSMGRAGHCPFVGTHSNILASWFPGLGHRQTAIEALRLLQAVGSTRGALRRAQTLAK